VSTVFLVLYGLVCLGCILYWTPKRTPSGAWAILSPSGFLWVLQLGCITFVWIRHDSLLRLLWLVPASVIGYLIIAKLLYSTGVYRSGV
jgi:hypothetical protein